MGILTVIKSIMPVILYGIGLVLVVRALAGKTEWLLMLVIVMLPLRNVIEKLHALPLGKDFIDIAFIALLIGTLMRVVTAKGKNFAKSPINPIILLMVLYMFLSVLMGSDYLGNYTLFDPSDIRVQSWKNFCMMPVLFFITLNTINDRKWVWRTVLVICATMVFMDTYLIRQLGWYSSIVSRTKVHGTFVYLGPNEIAAFINQYTLLLMGLCFFMKKGLKKIALFGLILLNLFCVLFLFSRGAYVALVIGMFFLFSIKNRMLLIPLVLVIIYWQAALPERVRERILETTNVYGELDRSSELRLIVWQNSLDLFSESPIIGVGYGVFQSMGYELGDTHNIYLKILAEQGIVGLCIFLLLILSFFVQGVRLYSRSDDPPCKGLGLGFTICLVVLLVNNVFGNRWTYMELNSYFWVFAALVSRLNIITTEENNALIKKEKG